MEDKKTVIEQHRSIRIIEDGIDGLACQVYCCGAVLRVIASWGGDWDHVSVSLDEKRCPTWLEMQYIKNVFFKAEEVAMQLHPAAGNYVNDHEFCLHIWRPQKQEIPTPPTIFV